MSERSTARLFVAVDAPEAICRELARWTRAAVGALAGGQGGRAAVRVLAPELMHVTLCFLDSRPVTAIEPIAAALLELSPADVGELSLGAPVWLPPRRPRALAVELHDDRGALARLRAQVAQALEGACGFQSERRRFRPHLTVARMGGRERVAFPDSTLPATPLLSFAPEALVLYRSLLAPEGARYEPLVSVVLG